MRPAIASPWSDPDYAPLKARIIARTGHHYYTDKDDLLFDRLRKRFKARGLGSAGAYLALLGQADAGAEEWAALEAEITIGETFFFRYAEQFAALRETILPGLVAVREPERSLRVWSAGCASGAEPYSIAILLHELLGERLPDWAVAITGTDISAAALATAQAAEYGRWALRTLPPEERARYFLPIPPQPGATREGGYRLCPEFRRMVRFERQNLMSLAEELVPPQSGAFDLILCRNVLIYFHADAVRAIVRALGRRLRPGGWLLIGHAEPNPDFAAWLRPVNLPGTTAYRRHDEDAFVPAPIPPRLVSEQSPFTPPPADLPARPLPIAPEFVPISDPVPVRAAPIEVGLLEPHETADAEGSLEDIRARIRVLADAGETGEAWRLIRAALSANPRDAALRYYEGLVARSLGREAEAERAFRGALYLDRDFVMAHYQLGLLLVALGKPAPAGRALDNAIRLGQGLAPEAVVPEGDGATAGDVAASARLARAGLRSDRP